MDHGSESSDSVCCFHYNRINSKTCCRRISNIDYSLLACGCARNGQHDDESVRHPGYPLSDCGFYLEANGSEIVAGERLQMKHMHLGQRPLVGKHSHVGGHRIPVLCFTAQ